MNRNYKIGYWNYLKRSTNTASVVVEENLKSLPSVELIEIVGVNDPRLKNTDLLVIDALEIELETPLEWIDKLFKTIVQNNGIPVPCLILNKAHNLDIAVDIFEHIHSNWYYDIINPSHLDSISIRIANLVKAHDHLHELSRYDRELTSLQNQTDQLQHALEDLLKDKE